LLGAEESGVCYGELNSFADVWRASKLRLVMAHAF
jgi:hypothetical protein